MATNGKLSINSDQLRAEESRSWDSDESLSIVDDDPFGSKKKRKHPLLKKNVTITFSLEEKRLLDNAVQNDEAIDSLSDLIRRELKPLIDCLRKKCVRDLKKKIA